jgi:hypothetical protein
VEKSEGSYKPFEVISTFLQGFLQTVNDSYSNERSRQEIDGLYLLLLALSVVEALAGALCPELVELTPEDISQSVMKISLEEFVSKSANLELKCA